MIKTLEEYQEEQLSWNEKFSRALKYEETVNMDGAHLYVSVKYIINDRYRLFVSFVDYVQNKKKHRCKDFDSFDEAMNHVEEFKYQVWMYFAWDFGYDLNKFQKELKTKQKEEKELEKERAFNLKIWKLNQQGWSVDETINLLCEYLDDTFSKQLEIYKQNINDIIKIFYRQK